MNKNYWFAKFEEALKNKNYSYKTIEIDKDDWLDQISDVQNIITRFPLKFADEGKEKLYILENVLHKNVYPNQATYWHYDNKNAQKYLSYINKGLSLLDSFVSYSYEDALKYLQIAKFPLVSKASYGAGSRNVRLLKDFKSAKNELDYIFSKGSLNTTRKKILDKVGFNINRYGLQKNYVNYQEFIPNNSGDFKLFTIGGTYAYFFFRGNRKNDFRASGSGKIDYSTDKHNKDVIQHFLKISQENNFDSMGYDILRTPDGYIAIEMSYTVNDKAMYNSPGYYELKNGELKYIKKHTWPQELLVNYLEEKWIKKGKSS